MAIRSTFAKKKIKIKVRSPETCGSPPSCYTDFVSTTNMLLEKELKKL